MGLHKGSLGIFAQLASGTVTKASAANDLALFIKDGTGPLRLILREGDAIEVAANDTRTTKTLVSFAPGNGSPGAGRGWLAHPDDPPRSPWSLSPINRRPSFPAAKAGVQWSFH